MSEQRRPGPVADWIKRGRAAGQDALGIANDKENKPVSGPIKPDDIALTKAREIPEEVLHIVNSLVVKNWRGTSAVVLQKDIAAAIRARFPDVNVYERGWLDFEDAYRAVGWVVAYDKPGYNETYDASFTFTRAK